MTNEQLYLAIGIPVVFNSVIALALWANLRSNMNQRFDSVNERFLGINQRFNDMNQRFDDMRDLWRAELQRVEGVLDARLKHLEETR